MQGLLKEFGMIGHVYVSTNVPVLGKPYQAEFEEIHTRYNPPQEARVFGKRWRDNRGSDGMEVAMPDPSDPAKTTKLINFFDVLTYSMYFLVPDLGVQRTIQLPRSAEELRTMMDSELPLSAPVHNYPIVPPEPPPRLEMLGEKVIEGVPCTGTRSIHDASGLITERWTCRDLFIALHCITRDAEGEIVFRLFNLRLSEPDPGLFRPPENPR